MNRRNALLSLASAALILLPATAFAAAGPFFDQASFDAAQTAGKPILLHVAAPWCETCEAQREVLEKLAKEEAYKGYLVLVIDFDSQKDVMRSFGATGRSTLIVFKGKTEMGRSVGVTKPVAIKSLMDKAL